jgi:branched-chain amino acid transport system ATP-binding protein/branched-chain amino acid transport system permease protein
MRSRVLVGMGLVVFALVPWMGAGPYALKLLTLFGIYVLLASGMNVVWGMAGQISLGQNAIYAVGAYAAGLLTTKLGWSPIVALVAAAACGGVFAFVVAIPALRVRGFYLAMVSLGFGMLVQTTANEWSSLTGGVQGLENIPSPALRSLTVAGWSVGFVSYYYATLVIAGLGLIVASRLMRSYWGRAMTAVRESEIAASAQGVFVGRVKVAAFVVAGVYTGVAGALYAHLIAYLSPEVFGVDTAVLIMIMPLLGGLGTLWGPVVGAGVFLALPELLQRLWQYNLLIYGLLLVGSFTLFPQGVVGGLRRWLARSPDEDGGEGVAAATPAAPLRSASTRASLVASGITMRFGGLTALDGVDLTLKPGAVRAVIGPNGSGKSTLVNVLARIYTPNAGTMVLDGAPIDGLRTDQVARAGLARTFQNLRLFADLSAFDNALIGAHPRFRASLVACLAGLPGARREEAAERARVRTLLRDLGLLPHASVHVRDLPYGVQKLVELARAVAKTPRLLLLDEPAAGLSAEEIGTLRRVIERTAASGAAVLVIEHNLDFVMDISDEVTVLDQGRKISEGAPRVVQTDERVIDAYLGTSHVIQPA